jgi:hypothetical protein
MNLCRAFSFPARALEQQMPEGQNAFFLGSRKEVEFRSRPKRAGLEYPLLIE